MIGALIDGATAAPGVTAAAGAGLATGGVRGSASIAGCAGARDTAVRTLPDVCAMRSSIGAAGPVRLRNTPKRLTSCVRQSSRGFARGALALCVASARATEGTLDAGAALFKPDAGAALFKFVGAGEGSAGALIVAMFTPLWLAELSATLGASALRGKLSETLPEGKDEAIVFGADRNGAVVAAATSARRTGSDIRARAKAGCTV